MLNVKYKIIKDNATKTNWMDIVASDPMMEKMTSIKSMDG